jgi:polyisoprenoid-binding protein YceI
MTTTTRPSATRLHDGVELPAPGRWVIDPGHAQLGFVGRHLKFTKVRGRFTDVVGSIDVADNPVDTTVDVTIGIASVDTGNEARDEHLRSSDLFDAGRFPTATFRGRAAAWSTDHGTLVGDLTIKGVTRQVTFEVEYLGSVADPWGGDRIVFSARTSINRDDFGVTWNVALETGGLLVSREIGIELDLEAILQVDATTATEVR